MVSELAKGDWLDLQAQGLNPTLEDFDRLNLIALRLTDGAETTAAAFPRVGWAGDVPFFEPTIQAFAWFYSFAQRAAANEETETTFWAFALAHARERGFFDSLITPEAIDKAVSAWSKSLPVTRAEVLRACRYASLGEDDARAAANLDAKSPRFRANREEAARNLATLETLLTNAAAALKATTQDLETQTPSRLDRLCEAAAIELGRPLSKNEAKLHADYDLTLREIIERLKKKANNEYDEH